MLKLLLLIRRKSTFLYQLSKEQILSLEGFADKSADNLLKSIEKSKDTTLPKLLFGLGIPLVGETTAQQLALQFGSISALLEASASAGIAYFFETLQEWKNFVMPESLKLNVRYHH